MNRTRVRLFRIVAFISLISLAACTTGPAPQVTPKPIVLTATPGPVGISIGEVTSQSPIISSATPTATAIPPTATAIPFKALTICLPTEPQSLYAYSTGDRDSLWARDVVLETLRDGPLDHRNFDYQPVLMDALPSFANNDAVLNSVTIRDGDTIINTHGDITTLTSGIHYFDAKGVEQVYSGGGSVQALQMTVTFKIKEGVQWEDGSPLSADDILFSWQVAKDPSNTAADHYLTNRANDPQVPDSRTFTINFLPGFKDPLFYARLPIPLPRHLYGNLTPKDMAADAIVNRRPISFGPFILNEWAPGDHLTVVKNPKYYRADEGLPHLDQITFQFVADPQQMVDDLRNNICQIGLSADDTFFSTQTDSINQAVSQNLFAVQSVPSTTFEHLDFDISPAATYRGVAGTILFQDVRIRTAFAYCIDRQGLINSLLAGRGDLPAGYVPTNDPYYDSNAIKPLPFDPAKGRDLLKQAGWQDTNGDGIVDKKGRLSLDYVYGPEGNPLRQGIASALQTQLKQNCGIEIKPRELSTSDLFGDYPDGILFGRQFDLGQFSWVGGQADPSCGLYTSNEWTGLGDGQADQYGLLGYPGGGNDVGYINPTFDGICQKALSSLDPTEKKALHSQALQVFATDNPSIILFFRPKLALVRSNISGFELDSTQDSVLWNAEEIDMTP